MRTSWKVVSVAVLLVLGVSLGYGWGNATHVWFANHLGVKYGPLNQNEIYGAVLPDLFGYDFANQPAMAADYGLHTSGELFWALYGSAVSPEAKAGFYGMFTHSNAQTIKGADWYAHGVYPLPGEGKPDPRGWVVRQGTRLVQDPRISSYIYGLVGDFTPYFLPVVGHTLIETAVDILVKRYQDPFVGARLYVAAQNRTEEVPQVLAGVIAGASSQFPDVTYTLGREGDYRAEMMSYGQLFILPESQIIAILSQQTANLALAYLAVANITPNGTIDAEKIAEFLHIAIDQVKPIYEAELLSTLNSVENNMQKNAPPPAGPVFAFSGSESVQEEPAGMASVRPTEFALDQNYPNPFNPTTTIAFALPSDQIVSLKVYNAIGQEVATLVNEYKTAGRYSAVWDAKGVPSGIYFCRLQAGSVVDTKKMTLLK